MTQLDRPAQRPPLLWVLVIVGIALLSGAAAAVIFGAGPAPSIVLAASIGIALGALGSWIAARMHFARAMTHMENFRRRMLSVERDQALWVSLSAVLHDIRNPMHNVTLLAETLGASGSNVARVREQMLAELERINVRMRKVREQIAEFSGEIERTPVSLPEIMSQVEDMIRPLAHRSGVAFSVHCGPQHKVLADPNLLVQAVDHLLLNSLQILGEMPPERPRRLSISVQADDRSLSVLIDDTGPGLPKSVRDNPFEPLGVSRQGGMGLGLTIAHALTRSAGGDLSVARTGDTGTQFRLRLNLA